ncbi:MAG: alcohol dehydrogenase [Mycobacterium sp.]|jgi:hypothetical protein|nr:alcohol dehydrogenase [Mycobacterium sp.]
MSRCSMPRRRRRSLQRNYFEPPSTSRFNSSTTRPSSSTIQLVQPLVLGYTPMELRDTLHMLADGKLDVTPLITGTVGLNGVDQAFDALADPEAHAKILIDPKSDTTSPRPRS